MKALTVLSVVTSQSSFDETNRPTSLTGIFPSPSVAFEYLFVTQSTLKASIFKMWAIELD